MGNYFGWIGSLFNKRPAPKAEEPRADGFANLQAKLYTEVRSKLGWEEKRDRRAISSYISRSGIQLDPVDLPWCAAFLNGACAAIGVKGTGSAMARSFLGAPMQRVYYPKPGDFVIFWRVSPTSESGHVALFEKFSEDGRKVLTLGGNQSNQVCEEWQDAYRVIGYTRLRG